MGGYFRLALDDGANVADRLDVQCTCPVPHTWCKHAVAVALRLIRQPEWALSARLLDENEDEYEVEPTQRYGDVVVDTRDVVTNTLEVMSRHDLLKVLNTLRHINPLVEPAVTQLILPFSARPLPGYEALQYEIEITRVLFEKAYTDDNVERIASQLEYTGNLIRSHADQTSDQNDQLKLLCALENLIFNTIIWTQHTALPAGPVARALEQLYAHHVAVARASQPPSSHVIDWIIGAIFAPGVYLHPSISDYAELLDSDALDALITEAHKRSSQQPEKIVPLEIQVALVRDDMHEVKRLCAESGNYDALLGFYRKNGMDLDAEKLVTAALDSADPVEFSPTMLFNAAGEYFGDEGTRMYLRYCFEKEPSIDNFRLFMQCPGVDFADAIFVLQSVEAVATNPDYTLLAATQFGRFDVGFEIINSGSPSASRAAHFAEDVGLKYDPVWALSVIFVHYRELMSVVLNQESMAVASMTVKWLMDQIMMLQKTAREAVGSLDTEPEWSFQVGRLKAEFGSHPLVNEAFAEWGL
ncbi:hypothetical protein [Corynebacterium tuscaniense]|uniref:hypothetical protein n=1 Tax=Corynebacterium tuscaniense TaxID=302449 RepID=UPI0011AF9527|nr:hypothetical protein [Corynebacterium tuscaniense]